MTEWTNLTDGRDYYLKYRTEMEKLSWWVPGVHPVPWMHPFALTIRYHVRKGIDPSEKVPFIVKFYLTGFEKGPVEKDGPDGLGEIFPSEEEWAPCRNTTFHESRSQHAVCGLL